jgi:hypothetical protein
MDRDLGCPWAALSSPSPLACWQAVYDTFLLPTLCPCSPWPPIPPDDGRVLKTESETESGCRPDSALP